jgi:hypothetical protein
MKNESSHFIRCPKFGGQRFSPSCLIQDRYKYCRKKCNELKSHMKLNEGLIDIAKTLFEKNRYVLSSSKCAFKNLPPTNPELECPSCSFVATSIRGLKIHMSRSHGRKAPGQKKKLMKRAC